MGRALGIEILKAYAKSEGFLKPASIKNDVKTEESCKSEAMVIGGDSRKNELVKSEVA